ncbi:helix-hairpin-helix domain-containing protein [Stenotrophomonas indicatrix]|uniref:helix-hairpin-helix domain-containing protein n=1 Tax=Stenotrophomonas indicatrix TaxID=2045451 RepID=UPI003732090B
MPPPVLVGKSGPVRLGKQLGRGGEGTVFEVEGKPDSAAKIYLAAISSERADKLLAMAALRTAALDQLTAWPTDVLRQSDGRVCGFVMANLGASKDIHKLYSPKSRLADFPQADWRLVVRAALNTARAFSVLHKAGHLVGDVNHGGVRVSPDATVRLIDTDSFQITHQGRTFLCEVGVQDFTPPELHGKAFKQVTRTANHDNFGLAVLIFQMLMNGRHPFAGRYSGPGDMPIEKAIPEFRYAYGKDIARTRMSPPPLSALPATASPWVADLWEKAFGPEGAKLGGRPKAEDWVQALTKLEQNFRRCASRPSHFHFNGLTECPWCPIERAGIELFGGAAVVIPKLASGPFNLDAVWRDITTAMLPPIQAIPQLKAVQAAPQMQSWGRRRAFWQTAGWMAGLAIAVLGIALSALFAPLWACLGWALGAWVNSRGRSDSAPLAASYQRAKAHYDGLAARWAQEQADTQLQAKQSHLRPLRDEHAGLLAEREKRYRALFNNRHQSALKQFLDKFEIERASIPGIGATKKAMLESFGIETAADLSHQAVLNVPGFGPALTDRLMKWRQGIEARFRFDPNSAIDPRQVADLDRTIQGRRAQLESDLVAGRLVILQMRQAAMARRRSLEKAMRAAVDVLSQQAADAKAAGIL